jgi:hypothetical protein
MYHEVTATQGSAVCFALSGLKDSMGIGPRGVAPGWLVIALSARIERNV